MRGMMMVWLEGRPLVRPQSHTPTPLIRRLPEGGAGGNVGKRVSSGYNRLRRLAPRSSGKQQVERTAVRAAPIVCPEESPQCARRRIPLPPAGIDAPTPARGQGLQPYGALTLFFRWRKKSVQKKASGTATPKAAHVAMRRGLRPAVAPSGLSSASVRCAHPPEKALYCPFLKEGVRNVARSTFGLPTFTFVRARAHSFPLSKRARLFPSAAYRRSAPPQLAWGKRTPCGLGCINVS